jgi:hypothetical protein
VVPHEKYPLWRLAPLREACARRNLYESDLPGYARDHFEAWFNRDVEMPAYAALDRLEGGQSPRKVDIEALVRFAVAQDLRTEKDWQRFELWEEQAIPKLMESAVRRALRKRSLSAPPPDKARSPAPADEARAIRTKITRPPEGGIRVETFVGSGRTAWVQRTKRMVREYTPRVARERWHIIRPCEGRTWPTCDHPLVRFEERQGYAIHGTGWFRKHTEVFLPLSPHLALYSKTGSKAPVPSITSAARTHVLVNLLVGHAHRSVFSDRPGNKWVEWEGRRYVDREEFDSGW